VLESSCRVARLLVVSRDTSILDAVRSLAGPSHWQTEVAADIWDALEKIYFQVAFDLLILDLASDPANSAQVSKILPRIRPQLPLILIGRSDDLDRSQEGARMAANDYLERPIRAREFESAIRRNLSASIDSVGMKIGSDGVEAVGAERFFTGISPVREREASLAKAPYKQEEAGEPAPPIASANGQQKPSTLSQASWDAHGHKSLRSLLRSVKEEAERSAIARALEETGWNRKAAARLLRTSYRTVLYKIEQYQMSASNSAVFSNGRTPNSGRIESSTCGDGKVEVGTPNHGA
jgi:DNA-binding NtrC family response regulator